MFLTRSLEHGGVLFGLIERANAALSSVGDHAFFDLEQFAWVPSLEAATGAMQEELGRVLDEGHLPNFQDIVPSQRALNADDRWKTFFLVAHDQRIERNCAKCPATSRALDRIPGLTTAFFSVLAPGKHLAPHRGPYNGVLRYHLPLRVPGDGTQCGIRVGDETRYWKEGESLIFDDSYDHEAWNATDEVRVVLFVDVVRPLPFPVQQINRWMLRQMATLPELRRGMSRLDAWNRLADKRLFASFLSRPRADAAPIPPKPNASNALPSAADR